MTKWEYTDLPVGQETLMKELNNFGEEGWELASVAWNPSDELPYLLLFKRPK